MLGMSHHNQRTDWLQGFRGHPVIWPVVNLLGALAIVLICSWR